MLYQIPTIFLSSPITGDGFRPWIAAVILIVSVVVLLVMMLAGRHSDRSDRTFEDEDEK